MKKNLCLLLALALLLPAVPLALAEEAAATPAPAGFGMDIPIDIPADGGTVEGDVFGYDGYASSVTLQYETLTNKTYSLIMDRPSVWVQIPGRHTLCFQESVPEGQTPARMALTRKTSSKELTDSRITSELIAYLKTLAAQYDTFDVGDLSKDTSFIGQMGYSTFYTAAKGDKAVRGYVIMAALDKYLYVLHFSSSANVFNSYTSVMVHLRESVQVRIE